MILTTHALEFKILYPAIKNIRNLLQKQKTILYHNQFCNYNNIIKSTWNVINSLNNKQDNIRKLIPLINISILLRYIYDK